MTRGLTKMLNRNEKYIIQKSKQYLVGNQFNDEAFCNLRESCYDAYRMDDFNIALRIARYIDGKVFKFNPVTGTMEGGWR